MTQVMVLVADTLGFAQPFEQHVKIGRRIHLHCGIDRVQSIAGPKTNGDRPTPAPRAVQVAFRARDEERRRLGEAIAGNVKSEKADLAESPRSSTPATCKSNPSVECRAASGSRSTVRIMSSTQASIRGARQCGGSGRAVRVLRGGGRRGQQITTVANTVAAENVGGQGAISRLWPNKGSPQALIFFWR